MTDAISILYTVTVDVRPVRTVSTRIRRCGLQG